MEKVLDYELIGRRIKKERVQKDLTRQELSEKADISTSHLANIENGKTIASLEVIYQIATELEVTVDELLREDDLIDFSLIASLLKDCDDYEKYVIKETIKSLKKALKEKDVILNKIK